MLTHQFENINKWAKVSTDELISNEYQQNIVDSTVEHLEKNAAGFLKLSDNDNSSLITYEIYKKMNNKFMVLLIPTFDLLMQVYRELSSQSINDNYYIDFLIINSLHESTNELLSLDNPIEIGKKINELIINKKISNKYNHRIIVLSVVTYIDNLMKGFSLTGFRKFSISLWICYDCDNYNYIDGINKKCKKLSKNTNVEIIKKLFISLPSCHKSNNKQMTIINTDTKCVENVINDNNNCFNLDDIINKTICTNAIAITYKIMVLDIETDGKIDIIQIAYNIYDTSLKLMKETNFLINEKTGKTDFFKKIKLTDIKRYGKDPAHVLSELCRDMQNCKYIIGHNIRFDIKHITNYCKKYGIESKFPVSIDTMILSRNIVKCKNKLGKIKYPKLCELHKWLFNENVNNSERHLADGDVRITFKCYKELINRKLVFGH